MEYYPILWVANRCGNSISPQESELFAGANRDFLERQKTYGRRMKQKRVSARAVCVHEWGMLSVCN